MKYEFVRMPDSTGFGDCTEAGRAIPVRFRGEEGVYIHSMYLDGEAAILGGRELWGFPKMRAQPTITYEGKVIVGTLLYGQVLCSNARMGVKHRQADRAGILNVMKQPNFLLKVIPHIDGSPRICELVRYHLGEIDVKEAWHAPGFDCMDEPVSALRKLAAR